jgi:type VI secretion system protein ImpK
MDDLNTAAKLSELATDIFLFAIGMRDRASGAEFNSVYSGALKLFEEFEQKAKMQRVDAEDVTAAKYALAAFVDEIALSCNWPGKEQWADDPLQLHFFGTYLAGEGFFEQLEALRAPEKARAGALEIYYLCLVMGFRGKFGISGIERLQALRKVAQNELEQGQAKEMKELSPHWRVMEGPESHADRLPRWFVYTCAAVLAACLLLYVALFISIRVEAGRMQQTQEAALPLDIRSLNG